jgi:hypothetical protein
MLNSIRQMIMGEQSQGALTTRSPSDLRSESDVKFGVIQALNGKIIEISTYKHNPNGPDWTHQCYIVKDGETLAEAMATVMMMKGLEQ